ncbi:unnamed protein product, partial [Phaeothamnion confervicola]
CSCCGRDEQPNVKLLQCGACKTTKYCSKQCQVDHWKSHKAQCKEARRGSTGSAGSVPMQRRPSGQ